jgi:hypothetical protein
VPPVLMMLMNQQKLMTLGAVEFIRRYLLHVLPPGFVKIRHFGFSGKPQPARGAPAVPLAAAHVR